MRSLVQFNLLLPRETAHAIRAAKRKATCTWNEFFLALIEGGDAPGTAKNRAKADSQKRGGVVPPRSPRSSTIGGK